MMKLENMTGSVMSRMGEWAEKIFANKTLRTTGLVLLFLFGFLFFTLFMFPYEVLKEAIAAQVSRETGLNVHITELSPAFPLGIDLEKIIISPPKGGGQVTLEEMTISLSAWALLTGKVGPRIELVQNKGGTLEGGANISLWSVLRGQVLPRKIFLESKSFVLDDVFRFLMSWQASKPDTNPLLVGLLNDLTMTGTLNSQLSLDLDQSKVTESDAKLVINLDKAALKLGDADLAIKDQVLQKAFISATMRRGELTFDENSGISSDGLEVSINGKIKLDPQILLSNVEMLIDVKIKQEIKDNYGFILDAVTQRPSNGEVKVEIRGPLMNPVVSPM